MKTTTGKPVLHHVPPYDKPQWGDGRLLNKSDLPFWGGKGEPPAVGAYVDIVGPKNEIATVLGYFVDDKWLMIWAERHSDGKVGDLAGTEIAQ